MPPKRRRRFQGLYYHSSPPKVIPMNGQVSNQNGRKRREVDDFSVKLSTIRIWMHEKDIGNLTRILWAGQGNRLRQQASTNPKVKRFLAAVPYAMNSIKDVHQAVIDNNLETLQATLEPPVPPALITCKDANGLNALHKAAGMGHAKILEYLIGIWPDGINETDITGKTPLHWAASAKNNMRCYTLLTEAGSDEEVLDYKGKTPSYYRHKPHEIERAFLVYVPEAPRVSPGIATDWEALCDDGGDGKKLDIKIPETNGFSVRTTDDSIENTSEADLNDGVSGTEEDELTKDDEVAPVQNGLESMPATPDDLDEQAEPEPETEPEPEQETEPEPEPEPEVEVEPDEINAPEADENAENPENNTLIETTKTTDNDDNDPTQKDGNSEADMDEKDAEVEAIEQAAQKQESNSPGDIDEPVQQQESNSSEDIDEPVQAEKSVDETEDRTDDKNENGDSNLTDEHEVVEIDKDIEKVVGDVENVSNEENHEPVVEEQEKTNNENVEETTENITKDQEEIDETNNNGMNDSSLTDNEEPITTPNTEETDKTEDIMKTDSNELDLVDENEKIRNDEYENNEKLIMDTKKDLETGEETAVGSNELSENAAEIKEKRVGDTKEPDDKNVSSANEEDEEEIVKVHENGIQNGVKTTKSDAEEDDDEDDENYIGSPDNDEGDNDLTADVETDLVTAEPERKPEAYTETTVERLDVNHNEEKYDGDSTTSSLAIEGFVQGESEDNTVQSLSAAFVDEASRIQEIIASGDMEQLAQIVLNGDGGKLLDMQSPEPEIQAFLNNVPNYMSKIRRVHEAAREGSLLSLQQALDRRKFAIAKDEISANGATPLHVAVLFGNSDIVRYLATRFTETTIVNDNDGRTALHYAATIKDNGHFYNLLAQLGANPKAVDKLGHTPEFYLDTEQSKDILSYRQLLSNFGAADLEETLLSDQVPDDLHSSRRQLQDGDTVRTLERCFSVIQESSKVLSGATASALKQRKPLSASSLQLSVTSYLSRFLRRSVYEKIKHRQTRLDHNLFDVLWPAMRKTSKLRHLEEDLNCGIIAPDFDVFVVFQEFLVPLIKDMHCLSIAAEFKPHPRIAYFPMENGERLNTAAFDFDDESNLIIRCFVECSRNLEEFELPLNLTIGQIEQAERIMMGKIFTSAFSEAIGENESGSYYTLTEILEDNSEVLEMLTTLGLMIPLLDTKESVQAAESVAFNGSLWPYGRGVYVNSDNNLALWLNCQEHLRVISTTNSKDAANMGAAYTRVGRAVCYLENQLHLKESYLLGYLQARPSYLGTGLKLTTIIRLPNLMKEMDNLRHLCSVRGLSLITNPLTKLTLRLVNMQSLGAMEYVLFQDYCTAVTNILSLEKDMSLTNSKHIATMLVKIFRRKKNSLVDRN